MTYAIDNNIILLNNMLIEMCKIDNLNLVKYLLSIGADIKYNNNRSILGSIYYGSINVIKYLLSQNIYYDEFELSYFLFEAINFQIHYHHTNNDIIQLLLEYGANKNETLWIAK